MDEIDPITDQLSVLADDWLQSHLSNFDPLVFDSGVTKQLYRKAFAEMAMMVYVDDELGERGRQEGFRELLVERVNDRRYYELLLRRPDQLRLYGPALAYASGLGELDQSAARAWKSALERDSAWAIERKPYALMDVSHLCRLSGHREFAPDMEKIIEFSTQCNPPNIIVSGLETAYALTHDVIFWHHLGLDHPDYPSEPAPSDANDRYRGLILRYLADGNYDIVLELVLCGVLQRALSPTTARIALQAVLNETERKGHVPGPDVSESGLVSAGLDEVDAQAGLDGAVDAEWRKNYHTNIVASVASRIIERHWTDFCTETTREPHDCTVEELEELGTILNTLAEYDLETGAKRLADVDDSRVADAFPSVVSDAVTFLEAQRTGNDNYGYWTDERLLFEANDDRTGSFEEDLVAPITDQCETTIRTFDEGSVQEN